MGLLVENGLVLGLSGPFPSLWVPLGISVENRFLEIVGLDSGSALILGEFVNQKQDSGFAFSPSDVYDYELRSCY